MTDTRVVFLPGQQECGFPDLQLRLRTPFTAPTQRFLITLLHLDTGGEL